MRIPAVTMKVATLGGFLLTVAALPSPAQAVTAQDGGTAATAAPMVTIVMSRSRSQPPTT